MWYLCLQAITWPSKGHFPSPYWKSNYCRPCQHSFTFICPLTCPETIAIGCVFIFLLSSILFLKNLFKNVNSGIPCLESSSLGPSSTKQFVGFPCIFPYQQLGKCPLSSYYWNTTSRIAKKREKDLFRLPCAIPAEIRCFPGDSFSLLQKVKELKQLLCVWLSSWLVLPLQQAYKLSGNF